jgi:suppressor for copper-sensitivity B
MRELYLVPALLCVLAILIAAGASYAGQESPPAMGEDTSQWHSSDYARVRLIRGSQTDDGRDLVGLVVEVEEGWHTYWRSPGALGLPPPFNWDGSENIRGVDVEWPAPQHIVSGDYETYGYEDRLVLPLRVARADQDAPARLNLAVGYAVCETVCIPVLGFVSLPLPSGPSAAIGDPALSEMLQEALARVPTRDLHLAGIEVEPARLLQLEGGAMALRLTLRSQLALERPHLIIEGPKGTRFGGPDLELLANGHELIATIPIERDEHAVAPVGAAVIVTLINEGGMAAEFPLEVIVTADAEGSDAAPK